MTIEDKEHPISAVLNSSPGNRNRIKNICHSKGELFTTCEGLILEMSALETIYSDQFTSSTQLIKKKLSFCKQCKDAMTKIRVVVL